MSEWAAKRFWSEVTTSAEEAGHVVLLDGRPVRTPAKQRLLLPTQPLAEAVAEEWAAQDGRIDPGAMPATRAANAAIDKVRPQHGDVARMLSAYGDTDLLCYRAQSPEALVARQAQGWDPLLDWADERFGARLVPVAGVMYAEQDPRALERLEAEVLAMTEFQLAGFHDLVSLTGSLVLGLAAAHDRHPPEEIWDLSRLDETWQQEQWGTDEEAAETAAAKRRSFLDAKRFFDLS